MRRPVPDILVAKARAALTLGIPAKVIARITGIPYYTIYGWTRQNSKRHDVPTDPNFRDAFEALFR